MRSSTNRLFAGVILGGQFMANVDTAIVNVATPSIGATLHASGAELQLIVTVYVLATAMLLITAARLGAIYGLRRLFLGGLATFTVASLACGLAPNVAALGGPLGGGIMALAFSAAAVATAQHAGAGPLLAAALGCGGFGFGLLQTALTSQLTTAIAPARASDLSGLLATLTPLSAVLGVATFGGAYLALTAPGGSANATHAFAVVNGAFAVTAALAAVAAFAALARHAGGGCFDLGVGRRVHPVAQRAQ